ncbi:hypothetical protein [Tenacibaculum xiamenense]|uniref:hypothetical protein n=1 Tax=Tenacibaculum xiamenense TaxID=1261553 RepID=UPI0038942435
MKKYGFFVLGMVVAGVLSFGVVANAKKDKGTDFGTQMERLAEQVERLVDLIGGEKDEVVVEEENKALSGITLQSSFNNSINPTCLDNWEAFPSSNIENKNAPWSLTSMPYHYSNSQLSTMRQFVDINGDGLLDIIYNRQGYGIGQNREYYLQHGKERVRTVQTGQTYTSNNSCVMLNNGTGWDVVYRCKSVWNFKDRVGDLEEGEVKYYGDCAQL